MTEPTPIPMNLDPSAYALTSVNIEFDPDGEIFIFRLTSGNQLRGYIASPKHAKRVLMLLQKQIEAYEKKFGALETSLPKPRKATESKFGF